MNRQSQLAVSLFLLLLPFICPGQSFEWFDRMQNTPPWPDDTPDPRAAFTPEVVASEYGIYSVSQLNCKLQHCLTRVSKYRAEDGKLLWRRKFSIGQYPTEPQSLTVNALGVYVTGVFNTHPDPSPDNLNYVTYVRGYTHDGDIALTVQDLYPNVFASAIESDADGLYILGSTLGSSQAPRRAVLQHLDFDGRMVWTRELPSSGDQAVELLTGDGYLIAATIYSIEIYRTDGSFVRSFPSQMGGELGQMAYHDGFLYTVGNETVDKFDLDGVKVWSIPVGFGVNGMWASNALAASDDGLHQIGSLIHANTGPSIGRVLLHIGFDGSIIGTQEYPGSRYVPVSLSVLDGTVYSAGISDDSGVVAYTARHSSDDLVQPSILALTGATNAQPPRLAVLQHDFGAGPVRAALRDAAPGSFEYIVPYSDRLTPVSFDKAADLNGNGYEELVVVSRLPAVAEVRDSLDGTLLSTIRLGNGFEPIVATVEQRTGEAPRLAVAVRHRTEHRLLLRVHDLDTGGLLTSISYDPNFEPMDVLALPQTAGGTEYSYALLGRNPIAGSPHKVEIRGTTSGLLGNFWMEPEKSPQELELTGSGADPLLAVLLSNIDMQRPIIRQIGLQSATDMTIRFSAAFSPVVMAVLPDADGNGYPESAILSIKDDGKVKAEARDTNSGQLNYRITLDRTFRPRDAVYLGAVPGFSDSALGLLSMRESDRTLRAEIVDGVNGDRLFDLDFGL